MPLTCDQIRQQFIDFFVQRASHVHWPSSPVVPHDDPTLLFTNAGMNQFKPIFLGQAAPGSDFARLRRAVNSQKCIRAGGKHNDLDDVGRDTYHHTFFEMLGNWSFGDYFKAEAIQWAWELLTGVWGLDPERLYATYFEGHKEQGLEPDREAYELWRRYLPAARILPGNMKDNFWEMGDTGPCGPCSELHYDGRPDAERRRVPGHELVNRDSPDLIEVWNLVFIQFNRTASGLSLLPDKHVDTGMGFERITRVIQGKSSNYDTDVFAPLFAAIKRICRAPDYTGSLTSPTDTAYRVIADHIRTLTFAITDGAEPSNEGRGYVLRRILRRAVRYGRQTLGVPGVFLADLAPTVVESMGHAFPELRKNPQRVISIIRDEEEAFGRTLTHGLALFEKAAEAAKARPAGADHLRIAADDAFKLHDTYGFPIDLTQLMAEERGLAVDAAGFHTLMEEARELSRTGGKADDGSAALLLPAAAVAKLRNLQVEPTDDADKYHGRKVRARVKAIWNGHDLDEHVVARNTRPTDRFSVVLDSTNFYAEMGGQVADQGRIAVARAAGGPSPEGPGEFAVESVRSCAGYIVHIGRIVKGELRVGDEVELRLDAARRHAVAANHTATHLLNLALRDVLGEGADQRGSLVAPDRLRFDFAHAHALSEEQSARVESVVRAAIQQNLEVFAEPASLTAARKVTGLRAVFGETYPDPVRVVSIGVPVAQLLADAASTRWSGYSVEFCGGTHLARTGEAEAFALVGEEAVSKGVRRISALTGDPAKAAIAAADALAARVRGAGELPDQHLAAEVAHLSTDIDRAEIPLSRKAELRKLLAVLQEKVKKLAKQAQGAAKDVAVTAARELAAGAGGPVVVGVVPAGSSREALLAAVDAVRAKAPAAAALLISPDEIEGKLSIAAAVPAALIEKGLKAGDWVREASAACGGKGGGRPDAAQGGGPDLAKAPAVIEAARKFAIARIG
ncbi:MAG: alanine--tRNA ligase [Phycisphaerales bacterium]|nr:alanine--tRNA ligase [Phycisphaerales bacterium]